MTVAPRRMQGGPHESTMATMLRCSAPILFVVVLFLLGTAVVGQFSELYLLAPRIYVEVGPYGILLAHATNGGWHSGYGPPPSWNMNALLEPPMLFPWYASATAYLPWWFLLPLWGILTAVEWRLTHHRKALGRASPVDPAAQARPGPHGPPTPTNT